MFLFYPKSAAGVLRQEIQRADGLPSHNNQITASRMNGPTFGLNINNMRTSQRSSHNLMILSCFQGPNDTQFIFYLVVNVIKINYCIIV